MKKKAVLIPLLFSISVCLSYGFQNQKQLIQPEKYEVEVRLILVDVIVTKDGKFVKDLTKDDFGLYEDGKKVPINSFELLSLEERELKILEEKPEKPETSVEHEVRYKFSDWTGDEDVITLCEKYIQELEKVVEDGVSKGFITG